MAQQFLNSMYKRAKRGYDDQQRKYVVTVPDFLLYTTKDTETLESHLHIIERPKIDFYIANKQQSFHRISIPKDEVRKVTVPYSNRDKEIAQCLGTLSQFYKAHENGSVYIYQKSILKNPNLYMADMDIEDYTKTQYIINEGEAIAKNYKMAFSDIEVDISNLKDDFPEPKIAPSPVNLITTIFADTKELFTFILYDARVSEDIAWVAQNQDQFVEQYLDDDIKKEGFKITINVYRSEMDLIRAYFQTVHEHKPDFMAWWNMPFDIPTILKRMERNGLSYEEIADIVCHPEVPKKYRFYRYNEDPKRRLYNAGEKDDDEEEEEGKSKNSKQKPHPSRLIDWVDFPGYTQHYDQLSMFSCLRKRTLYPSYKLDVIGEMFAGQRKLNLEDAGYNIKDVNLKNFKLFVAYNIRDVFVQYCIEKKQKDMYQYVVFADNTRLSKGDSSSIVIKNKLMLYLWQKGEIMGNAIDYNTWDPIPGAIVGRPELIEQYGVPVAGKPSFVFENAIDLDASSLYPSLMIMFNIFKSALFGHVVDIQVPDPSNLNGIKSIGKGEGLFGDLQCYDQAIFTIASRYMGLPKPEDIIKSINDNAEERARMLYGKK